MTDSHRSEKHKGTVQLVGKYTEIKLKNKIILMPISKAVLLVSVNTSNDTVALHYSSSLTVHKCIRHAAKFYMAYLFFSFLFFYSFPF